MTTIILLFFFALGTIVGSFLNVIVLRHGAQGLNGRSKCLSCGKTLSWFELLPLFSFLVQKGRCLGCKGSISIQYPLVELITGLVFFGVAWKESSLILSSLSLPSTFYLLLSLCFWSLLIAISVYDFRHKIIPDRLVYGAIFVSFFLFLYSYFILHTSYFFDFWVGFLLAAPFALLWFFSSGRAMGLGDAKLVVLFPWLLGFAKGLSALIVGFWIGAAFALGALLLKAFLPFLSNILSPNYKMKLSALGPKTELPLGPFLVFGLFLVYLFGWDVTGLDQLLAVSF